MDPSIHSFLSLHQCISRAGRSSPRLAEFLSFSSSLPFPLPSLLLTPQLPLVGLGDFISFPSVIPLFSRPSSSCLPSTALSLVLPTLWIPPFLRPSPPLSPHIHCSIPPIAEIPTWYRPGHTPRPPQNRIPRSRPFLPLHGDLLSFLLLNSFRLNWNSATIVTPGSLPATRYLIQPGH